MTQLDLEGTSAAPPDVKLRPRQRFALDHIGKYQPVTSDELGAAIHEWQGKHPAEQRCEWCGTTGREVGDALRGGKRKDGRAALVRYRRGAGWVLPDYRPADSIPSSQGDLPADF